MRTLFDRPVAHRNDPMTSCEAAEKAASTGSIKWWYQKIYVTLRDNDRPEGHTAVEIAWLINKAEIDQTYHSVSRRLKEMENKGWIFRSKTGRQCKVGWGKACPWWANFGKEREVCNGEDE
jgi:hypothetical protein